MIDGTEAAQRRLRRRNAGNNCRETVHVSVVAGMVPILRNFPLTNPN
jgi:hypothetical protein